MQIHELPSASPSASDYIPIDNGTATRKATLSSIDMGSNEITFTSGDTSSPSSWQTVAVMASNTAANLMNAISKMVANIRWLYNRLGTSSTGTTATTVTGAIAEHSTKIGNAEMGTTATTLTGAIAEVNDSVSDNSDAIAELNSKTTVQNLSSQISVTSAITLQSDYFLLRFGNLCVLQMRFRLNAATTANTKIAQLPVHPYNNNGNGHISLAFKIWGLNTDTITTYIQPDGSVNISANATTGNDYVLQTAFMCAN